MNIEKYLRVIEFDKKQHIRNIDERLFIKEKSLEHIALKCANFIREHVKEKITTKKEVINQIVEQANDELHYLIDLNFKWTGYILPFNIWGAKASKGYILSCRDFIIPQDSLFLHNPDIDLYCDPAKEILAEFHIDNKTYHISRHAFQQFAKRAGESRILKKELKYLRDNVTRLYDMLKDSVPAERKNVVKQIINHNFRDAEYFIFDRWIFVVEEGNILRTCYKKDNLKRAGYKIIDFGD